MTPQSYTDMIEAANRRIAELDRTAAAYAKTIAALLQRAEAAEAKLAAVPMDSIAYCWLTEVEERDDDAWEEHSAHVEEWLATQQEAQP